jgi:hypothetical protein
MGLGLSVTGKVDASGLFRRVSGRDRLFADIGAAIREQTADPLLAQMIRASVSQNTLSVVLHPCGEPLEFEWRPNHTLQVSAKTSTLGPGYHAYVIDLLKSIASTLNVQWDWTSPDADETGFINTHDFASLQREMAIMLRALNRRLANLASETYDHLMMSMPLGFPLPKCDAFIVSPTGPCTAEWCRGVAEAEDAEMLEQCRDYYIWWQREPDAEFWRKTGLYLMWCEIFWHVPLNEDEHRVCQLTLNCFAKARQLDSTISLPDTELQELRGFVAGSGENIPPAPRGIGYRRLPMSRSCAGNWMVTVPGYYYEQLEDEGAQMVWWFGRRNVRLSSLNAMPKPGCSAGGRSMLPEKADEYVHGREVIDHERDGIVGWAAIGPAEENGDKFWQLQGAMACDNSLCIVTICYADQKDKDWAIEVFRSITHSDSTGDDGQ